MEVTILEAQNRTGGRCLSLRTGDTLTEDTNNNLFDREPGETQTIRFKQPVGDSEPYLNAGPGRIPSSHKRLLGYLRKFGVAVEVYVMNSMSNLVQMDEGPLKGKPQVYRQLDHNVRGWLAQMVHHNAKELLANSGHEISGKQLGSLAKQLESLMISFGELDEDGRYAPTPGDDGFENAIARAGFDNLPGVDAGEIAKAIGFDTLLESEFWKQTRFFQPKDFLWQPTLFQPVGGMDQVQKAFARQVATLGGTIHLNSPVQSIDWDDSKREFVVQVSQVGTKTTREYRADYVFCNLAMPFLKKFLSAKLKDGKAKTGFSPDFKAGLKAVFEAQFGKSPKTQPPGDKRFLATTTKVGWQADRTLWQGAELTHQNHDEFKTKSFQTINVPKKEIGVVPIFGGISWTSHEIAQIWYPSTGYHDEKGVLTGAYNFGSVALKWGSWPIGKRLKNAREGARLFGTRFGNGLHDGVAIAWQNMPYIKGGWAVWQTLGCAEVATRHFNKLAQGTGVYSSKGALSKPRFFVVGDQLSSLPGWQEGAIAAAMNALSRLSRPELEIPYLASLPDTKLMVEGI